MAFNDNNIRTEGMLHAMQDKICKACGEYINKDNEVYDDDGFTYCQRCILQDEAEIEPEDEDEIDEDMFF